MPLSPRIHRRITIMRRHRIERSERSERIEIHQEQMPQLMEKRRLIRACKQRNHSPP